MTVKACASVGALRTAALLVGMVAASTGCAMPLETKRAEHAAVPLVIGHRGASGYLPEHTLASYWMAIEQGADFVEPDLVSTKDGVLVARHENAIAIVDATGAVLEATTDVADHPEFAARKTSKSIDGVSLTGWFTEDFTLAELKTLRARERLPALRPANVRFDGMFTVPTFEEILDLVDTANARRHNTPPPDDGRPPRPIGVYPETKHPSYFRGIGLPLEPALLRQLTQHGYTGADAPVFIQSFEVANLQALRAQTALPLIQLINGSGRPWDFTVAGDPRSYADMVTAQGLAAVAAYATGIGPAAGLLIPRTASGALGEPTRLLRDAHASGLQVHPFTFRAENAFLPAEFKRGSDPAQVGDLAGYIDVFLRLGVDGFFTDNAFPARQARDSFVGRR